jgi:uncharacterized protein DUF4339
MTDNWYFVKDNMTVGPISSAQLKALAADGTVRRTSTVWKEGMTTGVAAAQVHNLFPGARTPAVPPAAASPSSAPAGE